MASKDHAGEVVEAAGEPHADGEQREQRMFFWEALPDMPTERIYSVAGFKDGKLYVLGMHIASSSCVGALLVLGTTSSSFDSSQVQ